MAGQGSSHGYLEASVPHRVIARRLNLDGDGQGDLAGHGGEHRAVMVYQLESYRYWERELGRSDFEYGQFGENFTVNGLADDEVYIGDRYKIGSATFEVSAPRVTCYRLGIRMNHPPMPALVVSHHRHYCNTLHGIDSIGKAGINTRHRSLSQVLSSAVAQSSKQIVEEPLSTGSSNSGERQVLFLTRRCSQNGRGEDLSVTLQLT